MACEMIDDTLRLANLANEPAECLFRREQLRLAGIKLMKQCERVSALRRNLPPGARS